MPTELTPMQTFEEKVKARLKESIADMLPDEALAALTQRAVDEVFFKPRKETVRDGYNERSVETPSWFAEEVAKIAEPIIRQAVAQTLIDRKDEIDAAIKKFVSEQNIALLMMDQMHRNTLPLIASMTVEIARQMKNGY